MDRRQLSSSPHPGEFNNVESPSSLSSQRAEVSKPCSAGAPPLPSNMDSRGKADACASMLSTLPQPLCPAFSSPIATPRGPSWACQAPFLCPFLGGHTPQLWPSCHLVPLCPSVFSHPSPACLLPLFFSGLLRSVCPPTTSSLSCLRAMHKQCHAGNTHHPLTPCPVALSRGSESPSSHQTLPAVH